ncbi:Creatinase/aminopeptidase [Gautieria morchelliformis]|nr:Creatinase/aminopeptidase [Gautieria morchelliformis]
MTKGELVWKGSRASTSTLSLVEGSVDALRPATNRGKNVFHATIFFVLLLPLVYLFSRTGAYGSFLWPRTLGDFTYLRTHCADIPPIAVSEFHQRQAALAQTLHALKASAYIAEPGANALFFGNISQSSWHLSERPLLLIVSPVSISNGSIKAKITVLTPKFEATRAKLLSIPAPNVTYVEWAEDEDPYQKAVSSLSVSTLTEGTIFVAESSRLFISDGIQAAAPGVKVTSAPLSIRSLRERKSPAEVALLRCANEVTLLATRAVRAKMYLGIRQSETQQLVLDALASAGLSDGSALVLFGENAALPHGGPQDRVLGKLDLVLFDITGALHGYYSDNTRTFALKESSIPSEHLDMWHSIHTAQQTALAVAKEGVLTRTVDETARAVLEQAEYGEYFTHRLGHGIGLEVHEAPYLRGGSSDIIQTGHTFSDEPGIYIEGKVGIRLEDCFVVGPDGKAAYLTEGVGGAAHSPWQP